MTGQTAQPTDATAARNAAGNAAARTDAGTTGEVSPIRSLLIANRGEIAVRVLRTARDLGIRPVAIYADPDIHTLVCDLADESYSLRGESAADTYMNPEAVLAAAKRAGADAIHPGYGFLAEDAAFAQMVVERGLRWVGPSPEAIRALGDKIEARQLAEAHGVGTIPGISNAISDPDQVLEFAAAHGYPIVLKKSDSGGGRGITRLDSDEDVRRYFADLPADSDFSTTFVEKLMERTRHVETQCMRDGHGNFQVVTTRDCSVQRRNQKVIEEAPAPHLPADTAATLEDWSRKLFEAVDYVGVGTCEFLVDEDGAAYFLEVNPRLQVEHTVSEEVAGVDLVHQQLRIANGLELSPALPYRGHSIELRITSEDPADDLMPATGTITKISYPAGPGVRVDSFVREGDVIGAGFDSLIAKLIITGTDRAHALARARRALIEFSVDGLPTSAPLIRHILDHPDFVGPDRHVEGFPTQARRGRGGAPGKRQLIEPQQPRFNVTTKWMENEGILAAVKEQLGVSATPVAAASEVQTFIIEVAGRRMEMKLPAAIINTAQAAAQATGWAAQATAKAAMDLPKQRLRGRRTRAEQTTGGAGNADALSPIQATVVRVVVEPKSTVREGDLLVVLESMKMEKYIYAQVDGVVEHIHVGAGQGVKSGELLISITAQGEDGTAAGSDSAAGPANSADQVGSGARTETADTTADTAADTAQEQEGHR